jgi:hypothetical protein
MNDHRLFPGDRQEEQNSAYELLTENEEKEKLLSCNRNLINRIFGSAHGRSRSLNLEVWNQSSFDHKKQPRRSFKD